MNPELSSLNRIALCIIIINIIIIMCTCSFVSVQFYHLVATHANVARELQRNIDHDLQLLEWKLLLIVLTIFLRREFNSRFWKPILN